MGLAFGSSLHLIVVACSPITKHRRLNASQGRSLSPSPSPLFVAVPSARMQTNMRLHSSLSLKVSPFCSECSV